MGTGYVLERCITTMQVETISRLFLSWKMPKLCSLDSYTSLYSRNSLMITFKHYSGYFCSLRGPSILADRPIMVSTL